MIYIKSGIRLFLICAFFYQFSFAQQKAFTFAHITDTHIGSENADEDLRRTVDDINANPDIEFVIHTGDVTEFGSDKELYLAKQILDKLTKPYYIVPGNHDSKWSESGCNTFVKVFGSECFSVEKNGFLFVGLASGPNMRMSPGQIPREHLQFLKSVLEKNKKKQLPIISVNHYPLDSGLNNWYEVVDLLKTQNIQAHLMGHGHANKMYNFEGIPGAMGRSNLRFDKNKVILEQAAAYNIVLFQNDKFIYNERRSGIETLPSWGTVVLENHYFSKDTSHYKRPDFSGNVTCPSVKVDWEVQFKSDIGSGVAISGTTGIVTTTKGEIIAVDIRTGKQLWVYRTKGKIFSTAAIKNDIVIVGSTDNSIYGLSLTKGKKIWQFTTSKSVLSSPSIDGGTIFIGASDGVFRALNYKSGNLLWEFNGVNNFVECKPLVYLDNVFFGSWGNSFYALNKNTGTLQWKSVKGANRMLSPAAVYAVGGFGKVFIVAPDRYMTAFDAFTGKEMYYSNIVSCRESIGMSVDKKIVYIKTMAEGDLIAIDANSNSQNILWRVKTNLGYEIAPSPIVESGNLIFISGQSGLICAVNKVSKTVEWTYKVSNTLINAITPVENDKIIVSTMDGKVLCLNYLNDSKN